MNRVDFIRDLDRTIAQDATHLAHLNSMLQLTAETARAMNTPYSVDTLGALSWAIELAEGALFHLRYERARLGNLAAPAETTA
jgi:hypothetical protein